MQSISIHRLGNEPSLVSLLNSIDDNLELLDPDLIKMSVSNRKRYFSNNENLQKYSFNPDYIYSFTFYQHILNVHTFEIETPFYNYDLLEIIGPQPLECMAVIWNPSTDTNKIINSSAKSEQSSDFVACDDSIEIEPVRKWNYLYQIQIWHERSQKNNFL